MSFASGCDNYQMWALYTQNIGFCLEFDTGKFPFLHYGPFPINYTENIPGPVHIGDVGGNLAMIIQTNIKNVWWNYEDEWRLYIPNPIGFDLKFFGNEFEESKYNRGDEHDRKFKYPIDALKSVILVPKFFDKLVANPVSLDEMDVVCLPDKSLEFNVLDFLARITEKVEVEIRLAHLSGFSHYEFIPIHILKYSDRKFRITNPYSEPPCDPSQQQGQSAGEHHRGRAAHALLPQDRPPDRHGALQQGGGDTGLSGTAPAGG